MEILSIGNMIAAILRSESEGNYAVSFFEQVMLAKDMTEWNWQRFLLSSPPGACMGQVSQVTQPLDIGKRFPCSICAYVTGEAIR